MANILWSPVLISRVPWQFCYTPNASSYAGSKVSTVFRFISSADADPGTYQYILELGGTQKVVLMTVDAGGIISGVYVDPYISPSASGGGTTTGIGTYEVQVVRGEVLYLPSTSMPYPPTCSAEGWSEADITNDVEFIDLEVPISRFASATNGGGCVILPAQYTVEGFKAKGSYQADWVGGGIDPPGPSDGVVTFSFFPGKNGVPIIPEEDKAQVPIEFTNGGNYTAQICVNGNCVAVDPGGTIDFTWPTYEGDPDKEVVVTYPDCPLCIPVIVPLPDWDPYDPDDPTNCTPAPGVTCPVFTIYIPPPTTNPDPNPEPEPEPGPADGNEGNFQGCIQAPCAIPYVYNFRSKP